MPRRAHYDEHVAQLEAGARPTVATLLDATLDSEVRMLRFEDNRKAPHGGRRRNDGQTLVLCERCQRLCPLEYIAEPGVTDFICKDCI